MVIAVGSGAFWGIKFHAEFSIDLKLDKCNVYHVNTKVIIFS